MTQPPISTLTYRSVATAPMAPSELERLLAKAKARNQSLGVTGMLMFSDNHFFQWLEGPADGLARIWNAIQADPRHSGVELLDHHSQSTRLFAGWDMKLVSADPRLASLRDPSDPASMLPQRLLDHAAELAVNGNHEAIYHGLQELLLMGYEMTGLHGALFEPVSRLLGDWWADDRIGLLDISIGLAHLRTAVRRITAERAETEWVGGVVRQILITPVPGEPHVLGAALVGDVFSRAGWEATVEFPADAVALAACVRSNRFDVVSLCLSDVFDRIESVGSLAKAISVVRAASGNPNLVVLAGGRLFRTQPEFADFVGADAVYGGAAEALRKALVSLTNATPTHHLGAIGQTQLH